MTTAKTPKDQMAPGADGTLQGPPAGDYLHLELVDEPATRPPPPPAEPGAAVSPQEPPAARPATPPASTPVPSPAPRPVVRPSRPPPPPVADGDHEDDVEPTRRPRWLLPASFAALMLVLAGVGLVILGSGSSRDEPGASSTLGSIFARRARERSTAEKAATEADAEAARAAAAAAEELPLPPPPVFAPEGPQVQDLDEAIALARRELVLANQTTTAAEGQPAEAETAATDASGVIQPRNRRLAKILELYDGGNPDLAADSLEIFLRDFADDPITQRILTPKPAAEPVPATQAAPAPESAPDSPE